MKLSYQIAYRIFKEIVKGLPLTKNEDKYIPVIKSALEKQIPKKCKKFKDACSCGYGVFPHMNFCSHCGQALDWGDTE